MKENLSNTFKRILKKYENKVKEVFTDGRKLKNEEASRVNYIQAHSDLKSELKKLLERAKHCLKGDYAKDIEYKKGVDQFFKEQVPLYEIKTIEEAQTVKQFNWKDILIVGFLIAEAYFCYNLAMDYYGDPSKENIIKSIIWASGLLIGSYVLKKATTFFPSWVKYLYTGLFVGSFVAFFYYMISITNGENLKYSSFKNKTNISKIEKNTDQRNARGALVLTFLFAGLSLGAFIRDPKQERESLAILQNTKTFRDNRIQIRSWEYLISDTRNELENQSGKSENDLSLEAYSKYLEGLRRAKKGPKRNIKEMEVIAKVDKLKKLDKLTVCCYCWSMRDLLQEWPPLDGK